MTRRLRGETAPAIGITANPSHHRSGELGGELVAWLLDQGYRVIIERSDLFDEIEKRSGVEIDSIAAMARRVRLMIVLGGDGTLLHAGRHFLDTETPLLAINLGRLGFLTDTPAGNMIHVVEQALAGKLKSRRHFGLRAECRRNGRGLLSAFAVNDVVVQRSHNPRMVTFAMTIRGQFVFRMRADGLIIATPAGSTAYALSAGGAILHPEVDAVSVVPICPHTLSNRPIVVPARDRMVITLHDHPAALSLDGNPALTLEKGDTIHLTRAGSFTLLHQPERHYYEILRHKLHWADQAEGAP